MFREEGEGGETLMPERNIHWLPPGDPAHSPCMCPDWELNKQSFGAQDSAQPIKPQQPGQSEFTC